MDGNPTGHTIVHREPEWDDYDRSEAYALLLDERRTCKRCGLTDTFDVLPHVDDVMWADGRRYTVRQFRCLACGALDLVQRITDKKHADVKTPDGQYAPGDGLRLAVEPTESG